MSYQPRSKQGSSSLNWRGDGGRPPVPLYPVCLPAVQVTCASPPWLRGREVAALDSQDLGCRMKQRFPREVSTVQQITVTYSNSELCSYKGVHKVNLPSPFYHPRGTAGRDSWLCTTPRGH